MQIKISVIIPTYRRPELLLRCLTAISKQSFSPACFEVIVVSDGIDKRTHAFLQNWAGKKKLNLTYLCTSGKQGPAAARNIGWLKAKADLIAFTDDDCIPDKNWLKALDRMYHQEQYAAFTGTTKVPLDFPPSDFANNTYQLQRAEFITANCACTKKTLKLLGGFDERFKLAWREDSDLHFCLLMSGIPITPVNDAIIVHPVRYAPWGISLQEQKKGIYDALLFKKHPQLYRCKVETYPNWNYYLTILLWALLLIFSYSHSLPAIVITTLLLLFTIAGFLHKRLKNTSKSIRHITEMLATSIAIPFLSVYWRIYGAVKFRVFFI